MPWGRWATKKDGIVHFAIRSKTDGEVLLRCWNDRPYEYVPVTVKCKPGTPVTCLWCRTYQ